MRKIYGILALSFILTCTSSSAQQPVRAGTIVRNRVVTDKDSVEFYEVEYDTRQKSYMNLLAGNWVFNTMHRQARMNAESLAKINLTINADSSYTGTIGCSKMNGRLSIKGTSVRFNNINQVNNNCSFTDQETWVLKLLQGTVSNYTVNDSSLLLRDGSSNIVFEAKRNNQ